MESAPRGRGERPQNDRRPIDRRPQSPRPQPSEPAIPPEPLVETAFRDALESPATAEAIVALDVRDENREAAVFQRLGPEALARLRARHSEVKARIAERQMEQPERDELNGRAERLNPDGWVTDADVNEGLEQYETIYESIRAVIGHGRKRRERGARS